MDTFTKYIGTNGVCYGLTEKGEYFSYDPKNMGSFYHSTPEEARASAIRINKRIEAEEESGNRKFDRMIAMDSTIKDNTMNLSESDISKLVSECVKRLMKEGLFDETEFGDDIPQKAQKLSDVIKMNAWTGRIVKRSAEMLIMHLYTDNNSMKTRNYPDIEKVLNDLREWCRLHNSNTVFEKLNVITKKGVFIRVSKQK